VSSLLQGDAPVVDLRESTVLSVIAMLRGGGLIAFVVLALALAGCGKVSSTKPDAKSIDAPAAKQPCVLNQSKIDDCTL
jgi:hypothetical protein